MLLLLLLLLMMCLCLCSYVLMRVGAYAFVLLCVDACR